VATRSVPIGGAHFTNDLRWAEYDGGRGEELKCQYGHAVVTDVPRKRLSRSPVLSADLAVAHDC